jgi:hypothetical protein
MGWQKGLKDGLGIPHQTDWFGEECKKEYIEYETYA